jgi:hypothetical protein
LFAVAPSFSGLPVLRWIMDSIYPNCQTTPRVVNLGGYSKSELLNKLVESSISMNVWAETILSSSYFTASSSRYSVTTVEINVRDLGFPDGSTITDIFEAALQSGLRLCPLELAPYFRLDYRDQAEGSRGKPVLEHQAPYGSITIASAILTANDDFPKGFYLRRIEDVLWLRGYRSGADHIWSPNDRFAFLRAGEQR